MIDPNTIESYLARLTLPYKEAGEGTWVVDDEGDDIPPVVVALHDPLVLFQTRVMPVPDGAGASFYRTLLELNVTGMTAGAYGVDADWVVVVDALQAENLDFNEFQGAIDGIVMALNEHYPVLRDLQRS